MYPHCMNMNTVMLKKPFLDPTRITSIEALLVTCQSLSKSAMLSGSWCPQRKRCVSLYVPHALPLDPLRLFPTGPCKQIAAQHFVRMCPPLEKPELYSI